MISLEVTFFEEIFRACLTEFYRNRYRKIQMKGSPSLQPLIEQTLLPPFQCLQQPASDGDDLEL